MQLLVRANNANVPNYKQTVSAAFGWMEAPASRPSFSLSLSLSVCLSLVTHPFFSPLPTTLLSGGAYVCLSLCLTVRDGCSGLWVTESSCVVDGLFVCQRAQEFDLFCVSLTAALLFYRPSGGLRRPRPQIRGASASSATPGSAGGRNYFDRWGGNVGTLPRRTGGTGCLRWAARFIPCFVCPIPE